MKMHLFRQVTMNDELLENFPFGRELSMQAYVLEHPALLKLGNTYDDVNVYEDEIPIKDGGKNKDGRIDMVVTYSGEHIAIIEFKNTELLGKHLKQLKGYLDQKEQLTDLDPPILSKDQTETPKWIGILVGTSIDPDLAQSISSGNLDRYEIPKDIPIAAITIERFRGTTGNVYITTDTYFKNRSARDYTQYEFNGKQHPKNRLVLEVLKQYVLDNPEITFSELREEFPKNIQGSYEIIVERNSAVLDYNERVQKRTANNQEGKPPRYYFTDEVDAIKLQSGEKIAVVSLWGKDNIKNFIKKVIKLGYMNKQQSKTQATKSHSTKDKSESNRDLTQYEFNGKLYGKGRLVLAIVKEHVARHPKISHKRLRNAFPEELANNKIFTTLAKAKDVSTRTKHSRNFIKDEDVIELMDGLKIAVSTEWSIDNIQRFLKRAEELGYKIY